MAESGNGPYEINVPLPNPETAVSEPHEHDVVLGRGAFTNFHPGNVWYRELAVSRRPLYKRSPRHAKLLVSKDIVRQVLSRSPPGRFLRKDESTGLWIPVSFKTAVEKTSKILREKRVATDGSVSARAQVQPAAVLLPQDAVAPAQIDSKPPARLPWSRDHQLHSPSLESPTYRSDEDKQDIVRGRRVPDGPALIRQVAQWWRVGDERHIPQEAPMQALIPSDVQREWSGVTQRYADLQQEVDHASQHGVDAIAVGTIDALKVQLEQMKVAVVSNSHPTQLQLQQHEHHPRDVSSSSSSATDMASAPSYLLASQAMLSPDSSRYFGVGEMGEGQMNAAGGDPNNSVGLMPQPQLGTLQFEGNARRLFDHSGAAHSLHDPLYGRESSGSLIEEDDDD